MDHDFYSLEEAAKELDCEINALLEEGASGKIGLCIYYRGYDLSSPAEIDQELGLSFRMHVEKFLTIAKEDIMRAYQQHNELLNAKDVSNFDFVSLVDWKANYKLPSPFTSKSLYLTKETLDTLKAEIQQTPIESTSPCLDENHSCHSEELKIAINAWTALFEENVVGDPIEKLRNKPGGAIPAIKKWLKKQYPGKLENSYARIATMINPFKSGGAPKR